MILVNAHSLIFSASDINTSSSNMFELTSSSNSDCITFNIIDDDIIESTENFTIRLIQGSIEVEFENDTATIVITDNDSKICIGRKLQFLFVFWLP